jgi:hypothetical protein
VTGKELFGVIVRTVGLTVAGYGAYSIVFGVAALITGHVTSRPAGTFVGWGIFYVAIGLPILRFAGCIVRFGYRSGDDA